MFLVVLGFAAWGMWRDCHIPQSDGLGWDGSTYGKIAMNPETLFEVPANRAQRCLPSLLVHATIRALGLPRSAPIVIKLFSAFNSILIVTSLIVWLRIVDRLRLRAAPAVFGFAGLFLGFNTATMPYYYPVLTDTAAMFLGILSVWLFFECRSWWLLGVAGISGFVWPSFMYFVAPLVVFPIEQHNVEPDRPRWALPLCVAGAIGVMTGAAWAARMPDWGKPIAAVLPLSLILLGAYVCVGGLKLLDYWNGARRGAFAGGRARGIVLRAAALLVLYVAHHGVLSAFFTKPPEYYQTPKGLLSFVLKSAVIVPGGPIIGPTAYLGLLFLAVVGLWGRVCRAAASLGMGAWLFLGVAFAFSVNAESRHSSAHWPMLVALVCRVLDCVDWPRRQVAVFCMLSALNSRAWVDLNFNFPELVFANFVVNMSPFWYLAQALVFVCLAAYLELSWRPLLPAADRPPPAASESARGSGTSVSAR